MEKEKINNESTDIASEALSETVEQDTNPKNRQESYEEYLQLDKKEAEELTEVEQSTVVNKNYDAFSDEELEELYEQCLNTVDSERTREQEDLLEQTKDRFLKIKFTKEFEEAALWFEAEYPQRSFRELMNSKEFLDFAMGIKLPIKELIRRYVTMEQRYEQKYGQDNRYVGSGSVTSSGATVGKDYFTPAEVNKMSKEEIKNNLETIKKSMTKWK